MLKLLFCTPEWSANTDLKKVLVKVSTLNDFYSTNIYDTFEVSKAILEIKDFDSMYSKEKIADAIKYAKDLKDRYTVLWLYAGLKNMI